MSALEDNHKRHNSQWSLNRSWPKGGKGVSFDREATIIDKNLWETSEKLSFT